MRISDWSSDVCSSDLAKDRAKVGKDAIERFMIRPLRVLGRGGEERGDIGDVLIGQARCLRVHRAVRAVTALVLVQCGGDVFRRLAAKLGHAIGRINVVVLRNRSEEHTSELQSLMRISYAVFCLNKKNKSTRITTYNSYTNMQHNIYFTNKNTN